MTTVTDSAKVDGDVFKVIDADQLPHATEAGWVLSMVLPETLPITRTETTRDSPVLKQTTELGNGHRYLVRISGESARATLMREIGSLRSDENAAKRQTEKTEREKESLTIEVNRLKTDVARLSRAADDERVAASAAREKMRTYENHLGKVRDAIGSVRFNEIVNSDPTRMKIGAMVWRTNAGPGSRRMTVTSISGEVVNVRYTENGETVVVPYHVSHLSIDPEE